MTPSGLVPALRAVPGPCEKTTSLPSAPDSHQLVSAELEQPKQKAAVSPANRTLGNTLETVMLYVVLTVGA